MPVSTIRFTRANHGIGTGTWSGLAVVGLATLVSALKTVHNINNNKCSTITRIDAHRDGKHFDVYVQNAGSSESTKIEVTSIAEFY